MKYLTILISSLTLLGLQQADAVRITIQQDSPRRMSEDYELVEVTDDKTTHEPMQVQEKAVSAEQSWWDTNGKKRRRRSSRD